MTTIVKHVIWDWNGTLLDDVDACIDAINRMLLARALPLITRETYRAVFDFPVKSYYRRLGFALDREDWDAIAREFHGHYAETARTAPLHTGIPEVLDTLRQGAMGMSILSACERSILEDMLHRHRIRQYFTHVRGLDNLHAASKLDQGHALMTDLGIEPTAVLLIGDTRHDVEVAEALGCRHLLIASGHQHRGRLEADTRHILDAAGELLPILAGRGWATAA